MNNFDYLKRKNNAIKLVNELQSIMDIKEHTINFKDQLSFVSWKPCYCCSQLMINLDFLLNLAT